MTEKDTWYAMYNSSKLTILLYNSFFSDKKLFSSGGQHTVWCSKKAVIYYKPFDEETKL